MQNLIKPRGRGYSLRLITPEVLIGTENPWTRKPFGREIKLGLNTRVHAEAIRLRDIRIGQIRQLEAEAQSSAGGKGVGGIIDLSPESALAWRKSREEAGDAEDEDVLGSVITVELERATEAGKGREAEAFGRIVFKGDMTLEKALEMYLEDRSEGNLFGYDPLAKTTAADVRSSMRHLSAFLGGSSPTLLEVTPDRAFRFRTQYLPLTAKVKPGTVAKHMTLLRGMWTWAITDRKLLRARGGRPFDNPWNAGEKGTSRRKATRVNPEEARTFFTADQVTGLLRGFPAWGSRQGDLMRLLLVTGCRVDEIGALGSSQVSGDGSGFTIATGKTDNARRFVPVVGEAQRLMMRRLTVARELQKDAAEDGMRLFPDWPLKPATGKVNAVSQWFTRYRREVLGAETDGKLVMHSFRHTWRTTARRAGVPEDRIKELGGWEHITDTSGVYDHGLTGDQLRDAQQCVWEELEREGYLDAF